MLQEFGESKCFHFCRMGRGTRGQKGGEKLFGEIMSVNSPMWVEDVDPRTITESSGQVECPVNILQGRQHAKPGPLRDSKKQCHQGNRTSACKMSISLDQETDYAELVLSVGEITLGEMSRKLMKDTQLRKSQALIISQAVCTLLNSGGGVVKAHIKNSNYTFTRDGIGLESSFCDILPLLPKYLDYMQIKDYFLIFVKPWIPDISGQRVHTLKTNLYTRSVSSSHELKGPEAVKFLKGMKYSKGRSCSRQSLPGLCDSDELQPESPVMFFNMEKFTYKETFCFTKSKHAEVKMSPKKKILEILPQTVSAFANTDGGYLFIGLDGKKQQIIGFGADESDLVQLESEIEECIRQLPVTHFCEEQEKIKYTCRFIQVHRQGAVCSYVCALRVERFCCAVFAAEPNSWHVEGSLVKRFTMEEWVRLQMDTTPGFSKEKEKRTLQLNIPSLSPCSWFPHDVPEAQQQRAHLSVVFRKVTCSPEALCMEQFSEFERYEQLLWTELGSLCQGKLVIPKNWTLSPGLQEKKEVILDVLHISQDRFLTLHSFLLGDGELKDDSTVLRLKKYCNQTALTLKQVLINYGGYTGKIGVVIKIMYLGHKAVCLYDSSSIIRYPRNYHLTTKTVKDLEKTLVDVLGTVFGHKTIVISLPLKF
ncbi:schlafen family member 12-like isoform X1 [Mesocricetus auratus]|uniref:Schlafen family member 12-like isoform X1 n=2 Tax=Mesocricetus auratus TaxID=10036 RepID=A0ABM2XRB7_MESAU|nr:schlafen family member 12-like isoform X1 [Mesocricetus auratus]XP_040605246.1 schlafen family member 12-like isoform X1 [Mesocricetus auratus]XP_040605247.1 schlafen family member 12-like isoform X1 [Mesocricetus auratus]XP_040605248.1 schlafen family member 12-like isoform X1 [Mesocricetus auratus]XP_040605249.1 schlafen family member 12-like isoform X1 [Mesocricetus auratus]XP_040605250.1 schlafen family member 12-like isoform X1 [Mesocricetus auratus]XP_040605256.1 schlafen family memb